MDDATYRLTLIALHVEPGREQYSEIAGEHTTPALVYEMIHNEPYRSPLLEPVDEWWSRETETDPPPELTLACTTNKIGHHKHSGKSRQRRRG